MNVSKLLCRSGLAVVVAMAVSAASPASAQSLADALASAYVNNPQLNAARAQLRVTNEGVPQALSGMRPRITGQADIGYSTSRSTLSGGRPSDTVTRPRGASVAIDQTLFNGWQTDNQVRVAEAQVRAQRETLRTVEQDIFLAAATAHVDVVRDLALVDLQRSNVNFIAESLRAARDRFAVGEVTRTDVAQAESRLAQARSQLVSAQANLNLSRATYRRVVGRDPGARLSARNDVERRLPRTLPNALTLGSNEHPQIRAAVYGVDSAAFAVSVQEAALYPTVGVTGTLSQGWERQSGVQSTTTASVVARVTVPIYDGGLAPSRVRQARESLSQSRIQQDVARDQIRALITSNWGNFEASRFQIEAARAAIEAQTIALNGVREEARVGQRTTLDVLNAQQELLNAQVQLVQAERGRVVAAYALMGAVGRLSVSHLGLNVPQHDPTLHYNQVRDRWHGLRGPGGE